MNAVKDIFAAVNDGDIEAVRSIVGSDPAATRVRSEAGITPVSQAWYRGRKDIVQALLAVKPELDVFEAATVGDVDRLVALVDDDQSLLRQHSPDGFTALHLAVWAGHPRAGRILLDRGASVTLRTKNAMNNQPLHAAAACPDASQRVSCAEALIDHGAPVNAQQHGGHTPLHAAAFHNDRPLADLLLANGADRRLKTDEGKTPADIAADAGHAEMAALLRPA